MGAALTVPSVEKSSFGTGDACDAARASVGARPLQSSQGACCVLLPIPILYGSPHAIVEFDRGSCARCSGGELKRAALTERKFTLPDSLREWNTRGACQHRVVARLLRTRRMRGIAPTEMVHSRHSPAHIASIPAHAPALTARRRGGRGHSTVIPLDHLRRRQHVAEALIRFSTHRRSRAGAPARVPRSSRF